MAAATTAEGVHAPLALPQCRGDLWGLSAGSAAAAVCCVVFKVQLLLPVGATSANTVHVCVAAGWPQLEVFPNEEVRLVNANQVPDDDYASVFDGVAAGARTAACLAESVLQAY